jgi:23S rRNA-/tRNA-specific pseudouridylate synthase
MNYLTPPILGDKVYGKASKRLYLHAYSLEITIPGGIRKTFIAPVPSAFNEYFAKISL